jgi:hypothetical protein
MFSLTRLFVGSILLGMGVAGCTPANYIQRVRPAPQCEVQACTTFGASTRCDCMSHEQVLRQRLLWPSME